MIQAGVSVEVSFTDLTRDGAGIGRAGEEVFFVPGALPGERARVRPLRRARSHWTGSLLELLSAAPGRRRPPCILADHCGGCTLQHLDDREEQRWKGTSVRETLRRIGRLETDVQEILAAPDHLGYRNRAIIPLARGADGRLRAGYFRRGSHRIVNMNRCPVLDPRLDALIAPLKADLDRSRWPADHDLGSRDGLRHLALRLGVRTGEVLLTLVSSTARLEGVEELASAWMRRWPQVIGVCLNLQPEPTNTLMGRETAVLAGRGWVEERFAGLTLRIGPDTFFQVHTGQAERVVPLFLGALGEAHDGLLVDAYCGIGTFGLPAAAAGWQVHGIEASPEAVRRAMENAAANGLQARTSFEAGVVAERLAPVLPRCRALFVDPPRKGLEPATLESVLACPPETLVYLSCDPATLARDLGRLADSGPFRLGSATPIDFFPNTSHVETLAVLRRS
ncbi:MAG: 23S rRNA (uracil(1939)-C(5))-methyltransferase RlmD [Deltaproteobacteria bacterium]|nr:23S rRNA (uracil(1939)-C(5))-methyltransferase RlmD [Deltaproteobacteria bacterium]